MNEVQEYQRRLKKRQELMGYCKKIAQGIDNLTSKSGERAIWELVQNARDARDTDRGDGCHIKIELAPDKIVFSHHGKPFDYLSLLALVNQNSAKDNDKEPTVGRYGTGFMTTHAFCEVVTVDGPFKIMANADKVDGFVELGPFILDRSNKDLDRAIEEMDKEMGEVELMYTRTPKFEALPDKWTSFTYHLSPERATATSAQLQAVGKIMPIVLAINHAISDVEIIDHCAHSHILIKKAAEEEISTRQDGWLRVDSEIETTDLANPDASHSDVVHSLQSIDRTDFVLLPPFPVACGNVGAIPSLFMWFPLLGSEHFGVNFVFHSAKFNPVEKRDNVLLPEDVPAKLEKGRINERLLHSMMEALFSYYSEAENCLDLSLPMCDVNFRTDSDDEVTAKFYADLQDMWSSHIRQWRVIPTLEGNKAMDTPHVRVLHPAFYERLTNDKCHEYEEILQSYASKVRYGEQAVLLPTSHLIEWSKTVSRWRCAGDADFYVTVEDVCRAIEGNAASLHSFIQFLIDSGNEGLLNHVPLIPNREGALCLKGSLQHGAFMDDKVYALSRVMMGDDAKKMIDPAFLDVCPVPPYTEAEFQKAINSTVDQWTRQDHSISPDQLAALVAFCCGTSLPDFKNQRGRLMPILSRYHGLPFSIKPMPKLRENEENLYASPFNFLVNYTMRSVAATSPDSQWLADFITEFATSKDKDWVEKLDKYAVLPNQNGQLRLRKDLLKNCGIPPRLRELYASVFSSDLKEKWVDAKFEDLFDFDPQTPEEVAKRLEDALEADIKEGGEHRFESVLRDVILAIGESADWTKWFAHIDENKAKYTFSMMSGDAQSSLFTLMDAPDDELSRLASIQKAGKLAEYLNKLDELAQKEEYDNARFQHLMEIGKRIEDALRTSIENGVACVDKPKDVNDMQCGQDIVVRKRSGDTLEEVFYIEVKSKWDFNDPAHMSKRQVEKASLKPDNYALCCVDLRNHKNRLKQVTPDEIIACTHVKLDIGYTLRAMMQNILEADKKPDEVQIKIDEYRSSMSAKIFEKGAPFSALLDRIIEAVE